jgi:chromatin assembly factor 1 subunit A
LTRLSAEKGDKSSIIELKNGKVVCKQKCVSFEKQSETLQGASPISPASEGPAHQYRPRAAEIVKFRELIEERLESSDSPLTELPDEYRSLIAKLAHERYVVVPEFLHIPS